MPDQAVRSGVGSSPPRGLLWKIPLGILALLAIVVADFVVGFGPSNVIGMLRYDQRRPGDLKVGDAAPDVVLVGVDGVSQVCLRDHLRGKPLVLIFGSYT